jgi:hypothetical protein
MFPVSLMLDDRRHSNLKAVSKATRISMSELVRLSVDHMMRELGDPVKPDMAALAGLLSIEDAKK